MQLREIQLLAGYEDNLAQSPRLSELTITPPDGPVTLPLERPLEPRAGGAALLDMTWQGAISPSATRTYLVGVQASARHAPGDSDTDWHSVRLGLGAYQTTGEWRWQLQGRAQYAGGALTEDSRMWRLGLGAEGPAGDCSQRWYLEAEDRRYREFPINDAQVAGVAASLLCAVPSLRTWTLGLSLADAQVKQLLDYQDLLLKWNRVYNLTAVRDPKDMLTHHLLDSLAVVAPLQHQLQPQPLVPGRPVAL